MLCCCKEDASQGAVIVNVNRLEESVEDKAQEPPPEPQKAAKIPLVEPEPLPAPFEWTVTIDKTDGKSLGLGLEVADEKNAMVAKIFPGLVQEYNASAQGNEQIRSRDWIMKVNGTTGGSVESMVSKLRESGKVDLMLMRTPSWTVTVNQEGKDLCDNLKHAEDGVCLIIMDLPEGLIAWNTANPKKIIKRLDRILEVNGTSGKATDMLEMLKVSSNSNMVVMSAPGERV